MLRFRKLRRGEYGYVDDMRTSIREGSIVALGILLTLIALGLFLRCFRYVCAKILNDTSGSHYAGQTASANHLMFLRTRALLADHNEHGDERSHFEALAASALDKLEESLHRDYRVITYLLQNAAEFVGFRPQRLMLMMYFWLLRLWYRILRSFSCRMSRAVVLEMASIVAHLAQYAGKRFIAQRA
jgi:hypothetical protein